MLDRLIEMLWDIKGERTFGEMAWDAGLNEVTPWRVMHKKRTPSAETMMRLVNAYPSLAGVFLPENSPNGNSDLPISANEATL